MVEKELKTIQPQKNTKQDKVWQGIKKLEKRNNVVVRPADKGGGG